MSANGNEPSGVYHLRSEQVSSLRAITQMGRAVHVWGVIAAAIIGGCVWGGVTFGKLATVDQVQRIEERLIRIDARLEEIEKQLSRGGHP